MAPEFPPRLVVLTLQISKLSVAAQIENVEPIGEARLRARWSEVAPPAGYRAVGSGAIYVEDSSDVVFDGPRPIKLDYLDKWRFRWIQGTPPDVPWVMIALIFPAGYTLRQPRPAPTSAKNSDGRVAVYWCVRGNSLGRAQIEWDVERLTRGVDEEVGFLNSHSTLEEIPAVAGIDLDSPVEGPSAARHIQVFLCHSSGDKPKVLRLYSRLKKDGFTPWLDKKDLVAGEAWEPAIKRAVKGSHVVLVCMSQASVSKTGFVQREISSVLETAEEQPEGAIFMIPVRLEEVVVPERLSRWQWVDYFKRGGYNSLLSALHKRASQVLPASASSTWAPRRPASRPARASTEQLEPAGWATAQAMTTVFVDLMRLFYTAASQQARARIGRSSAKFLEIAERHFGDLRTDLAQSATAVGPAANRRARALQRKLSWMLDHLRRRLARPESAVESRGILRSIADEVEAFCLGVARKQYSREVLRARESMNDKVGSIGAGPLSHDEAYRIRWEAQEEVLRRAREAGETNLTTIGDDMEQRFGPAYFEIDRLLLTKEFRA